MVILYWMKKWDTFIIVYKVLIKKDGLLKNNIIRINFNYKQLIKNVSKNYEHSKEDKNIYKVYIIIKYWQIYITPNYFNILKWRIDLLIIETKIFNVNLFQKFYINQKKKVRHYKNSSHNEIEYLKLKNYM